MVLDPFAGGGTTLVAARNLGMRATGCELEPEIYRQAMLTLGLGRPRAGPQSIPFA
ncbi:DNA methyltransferase [Chromobacterium vaccinii]|uniref:DNA methyltransferase n=1 Tax=Chromobacterium vaccinii TaxID=1108595 RepID=UPI003C7287F0